MAQRMAMDTRFLTLKELKMFVEEADKFDLPMGSSLSVTSYEVEQDVAEGEEPLPNRVYYKFSVPIPDSKRRRIVTVKKRKPKKEVEKEEAVAAQIEQHKKDVAEGKTVAHVPPVKGTVPKKKKRKRTKPVTEVHTEAELAEVKEPKPKKSKPVTTAYKTEKMETPDV